MRVSERPDFSEADFDQIVDGEADPFETEGDEMVWATKTGHVALEEDGRLIAHAGWVLADVLPESGPPVPAVGLGGVLVHRAYRRQGVGTRVVDEAVGRMSELGRPVALLFCRTDRRPFYERLGWRPVSSEVVVFQPKGPEIMPLETCWLPLSADAALPDTRLELPSLPF